MAVEGASRPVFADLTEETVFYRVPFGGARRVVGDGDGDTVLVAQPML